MNVIRNPAVGTVAPAPWSTGAGDIATAVAMLPVSVIVPAYGHADYIVASIEAVLGQSIPPREVIVIDDSSPDDTAERLAPFVQDGRIRYVRQPNAGMAAARNVGAKLATSEYLYFLDDDDLVFPNALPWLVEELDAHPAAAMAFGDMVIFSEQPPETPTNWSESRDVDRVPFMIFNQLGCPGQVLIRRSAFDAIGGFDGTIWGTDDWDLWLRLLERFPARSARRPVLAYRLHANNASRNVARMYESSLRVARARLHGFPRDERVILRRFTYGQLREYHAPRLVSMFRRLRERAPVAACCGGGPRMGHDVGRRILGEARAQGFTSLGGDSARFRTILRSCRRSSDTVASGKRARHEDRMKTPAHLARIAWQHGGWAAGELVRHGLPRHLVRFYGETPGDDLMCTVVLREMRKRGRRRVWMMSRFPGLFEGNHDVERVVPHDGRYERLVSWTGGHDWDVHYGGHDHTADRSPMPARHIIALMCQSCNISGPVTLRPYLSLTEPERAAGRLAPRQLALHSSGMSAFSAMKNKEWIPERLQAVVHALRGEYTLLQLGSPHDPVLDGCVDLRGKTSIRESAAILANSVLFLGQVGFLMHLTRAVDRPAVIIYGGREMPWQSGYSSNTNLYTELPCAPCWRWNACDNVVQRLCMRSITVDDVVRAVHERAARADEPLVDDVAEIPARS